MTERDLPPDWAGTSLASTLQAVIKAAERARVGIARRMDLSHNEVDAMEHVMERPMGPAELARRLGITTASSTVLVDRLEEAGHLTRHADPHDRRRKVLAPTQQGAESVFAEIGPLVAGIAAVEQGMTAAQKQTVAEYLDRVAEVLERSAQS
ncbi:MAG: MarR family winged helix-turn-helix transcriptional regulator [Candidatus Nanopelagicales bacterium]